jgi:hypothetical protein
VVTVSKDKDEDKASIAAATGRDRARVRPAANRLTAMRRQNLPTKSPRAAMRRRRALMQSLRIAASNDCARESTAHLCRSILLRS